MALSSGNSVQLDASEAAHALDFIQRIFHAGVRQGVPVLHEVDAKHALANVGTTGDFLVGCIVGIAEADLLHDLCFSAINSTAEWIYWTCLESP
jgi:hypothetical protein